MTESAVMRRTEPERLYWGLSTMKPGIERR